MIRWWRRLKYRLGLTRDLCCWCDAKAAPREQGYEHERMDECVACMAELDADVPGLDVAMDDRRVHRAPAIQNVIEARAIAAQVLDRATRYERAVAERKAAQRHHDDLRARYYNADGTEWVLGDVDLQRVEAKAAEQRQRLAELKARGAKELEATIAFVEMNRQLREHLAGPMPPPGPSPIPPLDKQGQQSAALWAARDAARAKARPFQDLTVLKRWLDQPGKVDVDDTDTRPNIRFHYPGNPRSSCTFYVTAEEFAEFAAYARAIDHPDAPALWWWRGRLAETVKRRD